ncbi:MAG: polymerase [Clostridia bacterium]|nr:polymerase [Clostridia bacterium]
MTNLELAWALEEMGDLLEIKGEEPFKVRAYHRAARSLEQFEEEASVLFCRGELEKIPGIGKNLAKKIAELLETGQSTFLNNLRREIPSGLRQMLAIPGLGAKSVRLLYEHLHVTTLDELEEAARSKRVRQVPGMGSKTELAILRGIELLRETQEKIPIGIARSLAEMFRRQLLALPGVERVEVAGSLRRGCEMVGDVDLLAAVRPGNEVLEVMAGHPQVKEVLAREENHLCLRTWTGVKVEIFLVPPEKYTVAWFYLTGSAEHRRKLQELARRQGKDPAACGLLDRLEDEGIKLDEEADIYRSLQLPFIVPELREGRGEIEAAVAGLLPRLVTLEDIKGDLHMHTRWSDGLSSIEEMVAAARQKGYAYLAITEHSRSLGVARGLSVEKLLAQQEEIRSLNRKFTDITILAGIEVDILSDGSLDYAEEILASLDLVIASIHSGFQQSEEQLMARIEAALRHPYVDILGHPTGRMLARRRPYAVDVGRIIELAAETGTILEINSSPDRLDLTAEAALRAKEYGVPVCINTDAHDCYHLDDIWYGVTTARRAWLEPQDIVNCWDLDKLQARLKRNRHKR